MAFFVEVVKIDKAEVLHVGEFDTLEEAVEFAKRAIDSCLLRDYANDMTSEQLFTHYADKGEHPVIFRDGDITLNVTGLNHLHYAMSRCVEICGKEDPSP